MPRGVDTDIYSFLSLSPVENRPRVVATESCFQLIAVWLTLWNDIDDLSPVPNEHMYRYPTQVGYLNKETKEMNQDSLVSLSKKCNSEKLAEF